MLANRALAEVYGATPETLIGKSDADFNPYPEEVAWFKHDDQEVIRTCRTKLIPEEKVTDSRGQVRWLETIKVPLFNADGSCSRLLLATSDITQRKAAEEEMIRERTFLASAIDLLPIPMLFFTPRGEVARANHACQLMLTELDAEQWRDIPLFSPDTRTAIAAEQRPLERALRGEVVAAWEAVARSPAGHEVPVFVYAAPITLAEQIVAAVLAVQDISALKEADRAKNQFLNMISHEMRTPLTAIIGWVQLVESDLTLCQEGAQAILHSARTQLDVLNRLILLSRILTGKLALQRQSTDLWALAEDCVTSFQARAEEQRITLQLDPPAGPLPLPADEKLLQQAIGELLDNALKYTEAGGQVTVSARAEGEHSLLTISDNGQGIAAQQLPGLGKPFQQLLRQETLGGLGIGLTLVRGIVEAHGGQLQVSSPGLGEGAVFTLSLPKFSV